MSYRQSSSSQGTSSQSNNTSSYQSGSSRFAEERKSDNPFKSPNVYNVTNVFMDDKRTEAVKVGFCKYNPLHVISTYAMAEHERIECPDNKWGPGNAIVKYSDIEE